jgi:hypothetical protein
MKPEFRIHPYQFYVPPWCNHPRFESIDYCWGLAMAADKGMVMVWFKQTRNCECCELSSNFNEAEWIRAVEKYK